MNRSSVWKWYLCGLPVFLLACSQPRPVQPVFNPMESIWSGIGDDINKLEEEHADENRWREKSNAPESKQINSVSELIERTKGLSISPRQKVLSDAFNKSSRVVHFGFDCDFHALVFFDDARRSWKVIKW